MEDFEYQGRPPSHWVPRYCTLPKSPSVCFFLCGFCLSTPTIYSCKDQKIIIPPSLHREKNPSLIPVCGRLDATAVPINHSFPPSPSLSLPCRSHTHAIRVRQRVRSQTCLSIRICLGPRLDETWDITLQIVVSLRTTYESTWANSFISLRSK